MSKPKNRQEYRQQLAEKFIHVLEEKGLSWKKEWHASKMPINGVTHAHYNGCNVFNLSLTAMVNNYEDPRWVTMVQIMDRKKTYHPNEKWHLKAGSKATYVEYWYPYDRIKKKGLTWQEYRDEIMDGRPGTDFYLKTVYTPVFNASLVEGMPELEVYENKDVEQDQIIEKLSANMGVPITNDGGDRAYYSPLRDEIHLPKKESFESTYAYNATALHELAHSTGHVSRLARKQTGMFGSPDYAYEELIAEMASCFMGVDIDAEPTEEHINNHKAYVQNWMSEIRENPDTLVKAIKEAQSAASYMDWKAELITEEEYKKLEGSAFEVSSSVIEKVSEKQPESVVIALELEEPEL